MPGPSSGGLPPSVSGIRLAVGSVKEAQGGVGLRLDTVLRPQPRRGASCRVARAAILSCGHPGAAQPPSGDCLWDPDISTQLTGPRPAPLRAPSLRLASGRHPLAISPIQRQHRIRRLGALLAAALVAALVASIEIEQCRTLPGAFSSGFSSGFDVSRKVCRQATMGRAAVDGLHRFIAIAPR